MSKLAKLMYYTSKGERKLNCYVKNIPKEVVKQAGIKEDDELIERAEKGKIIIERKNNNENIKMETK